MGRPAAYHRLSEREKARQAIDRMREPPLRCPECEVGVQPDDLLRHLAATCQGRPDPHPRARWVTAADAVAFGVTRRTLRSWVARGWVRARGRRRYLLRDVVLEVARRRRWRVSKKGGV